MDARRPRWLETAGRIVFGAPVPLDASDTVNDDASGGARQAVDVVAGAGRHATLT